MLIQINCLIFCYKISQIQKKNKITRYKQNNQILIKLYWSSCSCWPGIKNFYNVEFNPIPSSFVHFVRGSGPKLGGFPPSQVLPSAADVVVVG